MFVNEVKVDRNDILLHFMIQRFWTNSIKVSYFFYDNTTGEWGGLKSL